MKSIILFTIFISSLYAHEYYAKANPYEKFLIKSDVSGKIIFSDEFREGKNSDGKTIIKIDDYIDTIELNTTKTEISNLEQNIIISKKLYNIDKKAYEKIKNLTTYSRTQKDIKLTKMLSSKINLLNQKTTIAKLKLKLESLKDKINKKNIKVDEKYYIYKVYPKVGDFVNFGSPLLEIADLSKASLTIFVTLDDLKKIKTAPIKINGKSIKYKIVKILKVADTQNISTYKVELSIPAPLVFSKLVKVEIK